MGRRWRFLSEMSVLVLLVVLGGCRQEPVEPELPVDDDAPITTDRERYTPEDFGDYVRYIVRVTYTNTTKESVYLVPCSVTPPPPSYRLEHFDGDTWGYIPASVTADPAFRPPPKSKRGEASPIP